MHSYINIYICFSKRFGEDYTVSDMCRRVLDGQATADQKLNRRVLQYNTCAARMKDGIQWCLKESSTNCTKHDTRAVKTVRLTMRHVERLLEELPDLKVVHVLRDPRAVINSRIIAKTFTSIYGYRNADHASRLYCEQMTEEVARRRVLETRYPGQFMQIYFEDLATNPELIGRQMFKFGGIEWNKNIDKWIAEHTHLKDGQQNMTTRNSTQVINAWREKLTEQQIFDIDQNCKKYFSFVGQRWMKNV